MKKKFKFLFVLIISAFLFTGCTKNFCVRDEDSIKTALRIQNEETWRQEALDQGITEETFIKNYIDEKVEAAYKEYPKACLTNVDVVDESINAEISAKSWKDAFSLGLIEGLLVYPISVMLIYFTNLFGANGWGQIGAIIVVTIIIRAITLLITLKSSMQSQKLQTIQPQLAEIQEKIKNTTDPNERQVLSMKLLEVYKKNGINPLSSLLMPFISLPIFIGVWGAVSGTFVLRTGDVLGINLGMTMQKQILSLNVLAIVLFLLMAAAQFVSMKIPSWIARKERKGNPKAKTSSGVNIMSNVMYVMILVAGFALPAAMVIYWTVGAFFSIGQTFLLRYVNKKINKKKNIEKAKVI